MGEVTSNWIPLCESFYDKVELYSGVFSSISTSALVVSGQFGGPVISLDRGVVTIFTSSGEQISAWKWNNAPAVAAGWSDLEEALFVLEDGTVLIYSMFGLFKSTFSMGQEAKDIKILGAKIFPSHSGTGVAVLTTTHRFYLVSSTQEPRVRKLYDCGELPAPGAWSPLAGDRQCRLVVGRGSQLVLLSHNELAELEVEQGAITGRVVLVASSPSQARLCAVLDSGLVWLGSQTACLTTTKLDLVPTAVAWCGEDAVLLTLNSGAVLLHSSGEQEKIFMSSPLAIVQECDGVRIISQGFHDFIHKVDTPVQDIFKIASMSPGSILLMASKAFYSKSHKADEYIRMISESLSQAVSQCISAAGGLFQPVHQKELMKAAKFGVSFIPGSNSDGFYQQCSTLKLLNCVRHYKVGIPLTIHQLATLSRSVLMDRLISRRLFPLALEIAEFLKLSPAEGRSRVLAHWAIYKVETSTSEEAETARQVSSRLGLSSDISYSDIAEKAAECGKKLLAVQLLEHEVRANKQVPLLLKLGQGAPALRKAIYSGDTDLIYHVILALQEQHSTADFHMIVRQDPVASKLYTLYCHQHSPSGLADWLQQEDDFAGMAKQSFAESYSTGRLESRLASLVTAQEQFKRAREDFSANIAEENHKLLKYQASLEEKLGKPFLNQSLHDTIVHLLEEKEVKLADKLKSEFKVSERKYLWLKVRAYGNSKQWVELSNLARSKKSLIGFGPFIDQCLKHGEKAYAIKFLPLLNVDERLKYYVKLDMLKEAAEAAFTLKNFEALTALEAKAPNDFSLLETIAGFKTRLQSGR